ncbi:sugar kinase [Bowdeniella nasicola]|uniref:Sugar kinase n=1 Tax=Bowdeniella nasicola TaxID=208480 RepID=A0A1Q5PZW3_9ACTO|nr:FGGY-family carbohydrate kinase [Bowdeniella nasicola]OKL53016.1 sugar kinase [Bowdeniella nasicola]
MVQAVFGFDVGTSSSKGVLASLDGEILAVAQRPHDVQRPRAGHVEMDANVWWRELCDVLAELRQSQPDVEIVAIGVSGMGPCVALADAAGVPVRPAILYGVDTRAMKQVERLTDELGGEDAILQRGGSVLSSQAAGPKFAWVKENEPEVYVQASRFFMPASFLVWNLTGSYTLDHQSASQCTPLYDTEALTWYEPWVQKIAPSIELPELFWAGDVIGTVTSDAAAQTGLPEGIPVVAGTIDAWSEALSVDAHNVGDLMLMYGTTMFFVNTVESVVRSKEMWGTVGALAKTRNVAGGMATSGAITGWLRELFGGADYGELVQEAARSGLGARGLVMLPYFAGERTPILDADARGLIVGLTIDHTRGDLYRAALEATAMGVRHNIEAIEAVGGQIDRIVAVGGGTQGDVWTQIVSDVTGRPQVIPTHTIGAAFGMAWLAACAIKPIEAKDWNPPVRTLEPNPENHERYSKLYELYRSLYPATREQMHTLAAFQQEL